MGERISATLVVGSQRFAVLVSRFNEFITSKLVEGAADTLRRHGAKESQWTEVWVPGAWELPLAARVLAESGKYHGIIALGCVIRGQTPHFEYVAGEAAKGLAAVAQQTGVPVAFGVITADTLEQAVDRAGGKMGNKGVDAALSAIEMTGVLAAIRGGSKK